MSLFVATYPAAVDVAGFLTAQGFTPPADLDRYLNAAIQQFEALTGYIPFLGATVESTHRFDPPDSSRVLDLLGGFWSITSVTAGVRYGSAGTLLVEGQDYELRPYNAANDSRGWNEMCFHRHWGTAPASIEIVGKRGYAEQLPAQAWQAILQEAACGALLEATPGHGLAQRVKMGQMTVESGSASDSKLKPWHGSFETAVQFFQRVVL